MSATSGRPARSVTHERIHRLYLDVPLNPLNRETLYGGAEQGYTDYPMLRTVAQHACHADAERSWG